MPRMPKIYSPYGPRPKRSAQLVLIWMVILVLALVATFYLTTRERGLTADTRLVDEIDKIKEQAEGSGGKGKGKAKGQVAEVVPEMVP
ncbi:hypothetical protein F5Y05DRAFT_329528 [Hypoxylon sp. FL0543]|nr:hypothetical protein F5Y05DRAFT_329528 [Hypoxylon sp. FL0543]